jgi:1-acyl-sn-glycerol-3-phosphate acyltransferase
MKPLSWWLFLPLNVMQAVGTIAWGVVWISVALLARFVSGSRAPALWLARHVWAPGQIWIGVASLSVEGRERLPAGPCLLVANHRSWIDIPALFVAFPRPLHFLAKKELARVPFLGWYIEAMGMVFVDRGDRRRAASSVDRARALLDAGASLASFPEGTRSLPDELRPFRSGGFGAAIDAGVEIVPVAIRGAGRVLPRDGFAVRPGRIEVVFGAPIPTAGRAHGERAALAREAEAAVARALDLPAPSAARPGRS